VTRVKIFLIINKISQILVSCSDENCRNNSLFSETLPSIGVLIQKFRENKISLRKLPQVYSNLNAKDKQLITDEVSKDEELRRQWLESLVFTSELFRNHRIEHLFIKILKGSEVVMTDLDVLPRNPMEELKALEILHKNGFNLFQFRLLAHPLKIMAKKTEQRTSIDLYPEPMWVRKKVCDEEIVFARKRTSLVDGVEVIVPSPEDDLYLVGTHAYNHLKFTLAEILHGLDTLLHNSKFDWEYLYNLAIDYGSADAIYTYGKLMHIYNKFFWQQSLMDERVLKKFLRIKICRKVESWFDNQYLANISFPLHLPNSIACVNSSFYHCMKMLGRVSLSELVYDFLSHYLNWSSEAFLGTT